MFTPSPSIDPLHIEIGAHAYSGLHVKKAVNRSDTKKDVQARQRAWLGEVLEKTRLKPSQLAKGADVSDTTLTRLLNNESYTGTLTPETIERIKDTYKVPGPEEYASSRRSPLLGLSEAARFDPKREAPDLVRIVEAIMSGKKALYPWRLKTMALEGAGYLPGDILFVESASVHKPQDAVCAQVMDYQHGAAETVFRIFDPPFLVGAANDRTAHKPMLVDGERVRITGVVRESFRPHSLSATR